MPKGKSKAALKREVNSGRFPPSIHCQILYTLPEERQVVPTFLKVDLHGADVPLTFICRFNEAECGCPGLYLLGCACICVHALYIYPHVYLVYMLAICSLLVSQILYNSLVRIFDLYSSSSATSVHHSPLTLLRSHGAMYTYIHTYVYMY